MNNVINSLISAIVLKLIYHLTWLSATGYSMGAQAVWDLAQTHGTELAAVAPIAARKIRCQARMVDDSKRKHCQPVIAEIYCSRAEAPPMVSVGSARGINYMRYWF